MKKQLKRYNDGYLTVYEASKEKSSFSAVLNTENIDKMKKIVKLAYAERSRRGEDIEWAQARDRILSLKVCCPLFTQVKTSHQVICTGVLYSVINVDYDRANDEMYLYLEEVRKIAESTGSI